MLIIKWRRSVYVIPTEIVSFIIGCIVVDLVFLLIKKRNKGNKATSNVDERAKRVGVFANLLVRGGDMYVDPAINALVDDEGFYEVKNYKFSNLLKKLLNCKSPKPFIVVTAGVLKLVEMYALKMPERLLWFRPELYFYRRDIIMAQSILWAVIVIIVKLAVPNASSLIKSLIFVLLSVTKTGGSFEKLHQLPYISNNIQYIESIAPRKQRVIMQIGSNNYLSEQIRQQIYSNNKVEYYLGNDLIPKSQAMKHIFPKVKEEKNPILSIAAERGVEKKNIKNVLDDINIMSHEITVKTKTETHIKHKYGPLSTRTKTLNDLRDVVSEKDIEVAKEYEGNVNDKHCRIRTLD